MKAVCSVCGIEGLLQQRGSSIRIQHYVGFRDGKRIYSYHKLVNMEVNSGSKLVEVNNLDLGLETINNGGPRVTRTPDLWLVKPTS